MSISKKWKSQEYNSNRSDSRARKLYLEITERLGPAQSAQFYKRQILAPIKGGRDLFNYFSLQ